MEGAEVSLWADVTQAVRSSWDDFNLMPVYFWKTYLLYILNLAPTQLWLLTVLNACTENETVLSWQ